MKVTFISYLAEYIGTFFFVLSVFASGGNPLIIGAALALVLFLTASISGGHIHPAVSLAKYMNGNISHVDMFIFIVLQFLGGISAYYAYKVSKH